MPAETQPSNELLVDALRHALNHLYEPESLRTSVLIPLLASDGQRPAPSRLQQLLLEAIEALRPPAGEPPGSARRRIHQSLQLRYEQQFAQKEVATQLGLSVRQFRRLQQVAVEAVASYLVETYALADRLDALAAAGASQHEDAAPGEPASALAAPPDAVRAGELAPSLHWILALSPAESTEVDQALADVLRLVQPLADRHHKRLVRQAGAACVAAIHPLIFRQAMLHLLNSAILHTRGDEVAVAVDCEGRHVRICIRSGGAAGGAAGGAGAETDGEEALVRAMLRVWRCTLHTAGHDDCWGAELRCGRLREQVVLVIDDHAETAALLMRSLEGTHYRVIATQEPQRGLDLAGERQPCLILLDVMMPAMDGWEVLTRLKQHESTASIPVVVCTVLDQSELALSLGADAFVRKPITREALLALLDAQGVREPAREPAPR